MFSARYCEDRIYGVERRIGNGGTSGIWDKDSCHGSEGFETESQEGRSLRNIKHEYLALLFCLLSLEHWVTGPRPSVRLFVDADAVGGALDSGPDRR